MSRPRRVPADTLVGLRLHRVSCEVLFHGSVHKGEREGYTTNIGLEMSGLCVFLSCAGDGTVAILKGELRATRFDDFRGELRDIAEPDQRIVRAFAGNDRLTLECESSLVEVVNADDDLEVFIDGVLRSSTVLDR